MNRREFIVGAAAATARPALAPFGDAQSVTIGGVEYFLTDIIAPSPTQLAGGGDAGAEFTGETLQDLLAGGATIPTRKSKSDRWGRMTGPLVWKSESGMTTLQEALLEAGAARVFPQSKDIEFIERCLAAEASAREARRGNWRLAAWSVRDAAKGEFVRGFQIWRGRVVAVSERRNRLFVNFGADYRTDLTATVTKGEMREWRMKIDQTFEGAEVELRGVAAPINGPSIELRHELQLRRLA